MVDLDQLARIAEVEFSENIERAPFSKDPLKGFEAFMNFVRDEFKKST